jgi:beta-phosphoglucomutase-like phosphatase (HAD superfamily)
LQSAVAAGMRCIMIPNPLARDANLNLAHAVVGSVSEIPGIVAELL